MTVIKCGGSSLNALGQGFVALVKQWQLREEVILVHGGGPAIAGLERKLQLQSQFNSRGQRITSAETLEIVVQCLCGSVNSHLVALLAANGVAAFGLSGCDGGLLRARLKNYDELGLVGEIVTVKAELLQQLCSWGLLPVVAPVSLYGDSADENEGAGGTPQLNMLQAGQLLNVNADDAASAIARAIGARNMVFVSDIPGIMDSEGRVLGEVDATQIRRMIDSGSIYGGMIPKVEAALAALQDPANALEAVFIVDGTAEDLTPENNCGTRIRL